MEYKEVELEFMKDTIDKYIRFSKDLDFEPSIRNINCFANICKEGYNKACEYFISRIKIIDGNYELAMEKVKSAEFKDLFQRFKTFRIDKIINKRLNVYFGIPGTGKTTKALSEANNNCILCNSSMLPSDLIEDFKLKDGKGNLIASPLRHAMENGEVICLDEIGTLQIDCLRMLQGITDNKESFKYKDEEIKIKEGFKIVSTMNLFVNGNIYPLTEALADRVCFDGLKEFVLSPKQLLELAF